MKNRIDSYYSMNSKFVQYVLFFSICVIVLIVDVIIKNTLFDFNYNILDWLFGNSLNIFGVVPSILFVLFVCINFVYKFVENKIIGGILGIFLYFISLFVLLITNFIFAYNFHKTKVFKINKIYVVSFSKAGYSPAVLINNSGCEKNYIDI